MSRLFLARAGAAAIACGVAVTMAIPANADSDAKIGNGASSSPDVTINGRYVVFSSTATNLVAGDTNGRSDIFIRDTVLNKTRLVSKGLNGAQSNGDSTEPAVSDNGLVVVFTSAAKNLVRGDTNNQLDVFRTDLTSGVTTRVSTSQSGAQGNGASKRAQISANGNVIAFISTARNLVAGDTNNVQDVFIRIHSANTVKRASTSPNGSQLFVPSYSPSVSFDGKWVGWVSDPFGDPSVTGQCGSVANANAVLFRKSPTALRPTITEVVCDQGTLSKVVEPRVNNTGGVGYAQLSNYGYAQFYARGSEGLYDINYNADYYAKAYWDVGRWAGAMAQTTSYDSEIHVTDAANGYYTIYRSANSVSMSPDGAVVAFEDRYDHQIYTYNTQTDTTLVISQ